MRLVMALLIVTGVPVLSGCVDCDPVTVPAEVTLTLDDEEVRTLPILASGATGIAGVDVPDAHGRLDVKVAVSHNLSDVDIRDLRLAVHAGGVDLPVDIVAIDGGFGWEGDATWSGMAADGTILTIWWTIDRNAVAATADLVLGEGDAYDARLTFTWSHSSCSYRAHGEVDTSFSDHVQASVDAVALASAGDPLVDKEATGWGFQASYHVVSGLEVDVTGATALGVHVTTGLTGGLTLLTFPHVGWTVNGADGDHVTPGDTLEVKSVAATLAGGTYSASGAAAPADPAEEGLLILLVDVDFEASDATVGDGRDAFAYGLVR